MVAKRIIPCLDVKNGRTVKGINFSDLIDSGDPVEMAKSYSFAGADELVFLDISATIEGRKTFVEVVSKIAENINIPFTVGGGISKIEDASRLFYAGADRVSINSSAVASPNLISEIAIKHGSQSVVVAIDYKREDGEVYVMTHGGTINSGRRLFDWILEAQERGAGELLLTSVDHDGTKSGFECDLLRQIVDRLSIPVIASGGAGSLIDFLNVFETGGVDAALAASVFHKNIITIRRLKEYLINNGLNIRL